MSQKRRDNKNRILNTGESQNANGLHVFKYTDGDGKPKFIYSWRLVETDRLPAGKKLSGRCARGSARYAVTLRTG